MKTTLSYEQKIELLEDPNTTQKALELLATDDNSYVRVRVAKNPKTPKPQNPNKTKSYYFQIK